MSKAVEKEARGVRPEAEEGDPSVFSGSVSDLKKVRKASHPLIQFCLESEPHWMFALFFAHLLFWMYVRSISVVASGVLARNDSLGVVRACRTLPTRPGSTTTST